MKRLFSLYLFLMIALLSFAHDFEVDGIYYRILSSNPEADEVAVTYRGTSYSQYKNEYEGVVNIPESVEYNGTTYRVTVIGGSAFNGCSRITTVVIPNGIESIALYAFSGCSGLTSIYIPSSVIFIADGEFSDCDNLSSIIVESANPIYDSRNNCNALIETSTNTLLKGCGNTILPNTVTAIGYRAFYRCKELTSITIPSNIKTIGEGSFAACSNLSSVTIEEGATKIAYSAFQVCGSLTSVTIPNSVETIGGLAFMGCGKLEKISFGNGLSVIGERAFEGTQWVNNQPDGMVYAGNVVYIYKGDMPKDAEIVLKDGATGIAGEAFKYSVNLTSITIPASVKSIGYQAFEGCSGLRKVIIDDVGAWAAISFFMGQYSNPLYLAKHLYNRENKEITEIVIPEGVTAISNNAFNYCVSVTSVSIPNSVTSIGESAFEGCTGLVSFSNSSNLQAIGRYSFSGCSRLSSIDIPNSVTLINDCAFDGCSSLSSLNIPKSVLSIGITAFRGCSGLNSITVEEGNPNYDSRNQCNAIIHSIGDYTLLITGCKNTIIPKGITSLGESAFSGCPLKTITIPNDVKGIQTSIFSDCKDLTSVTIGSGVEYISSYAFAGCTNLKEVLSQIAEPFETSENCWQNVNTAEIPLYVPKGTKSLYQQTSGWNLFKNIIERGLSPVDQDETINYAENPDINSGTDLNGTVIDDIYYHIPNVDGGYQEADGSITILTPSADSQVEKIAGKDVFDASVSGNITGIILMIPAGNGSITIKGETLGAMTLKVKVGDSAVATVQLNGKQEITIPYNVSTASYVYIYAGQAANQARRASKVSSAGDALKIYGIALNKSTTGIEAIDNGKLTSDNAVSRLQNGIYTLTGMKLSDDAADLMTLKQGIYIVNGQKVAVK